MADKIKAAHTQARGINFTPPKPLLIKVSAASDLLAESSAPFLIYASRRDTEESTVRLKAQKFHSTTIKYIQIKDIKIKKSASCVVHGACLTRPAAAMSFEAERAALKKAVHKRSATAGTPPLPSAAGVRFSFAACWSTAQPSECGALSASSAQLPAQAGAAPHTAPPR